MPDTSNLFTSTAIDDTIKKAIIQSIGKNPFEGMTDDGKFKALDSWKIADIGTDIVNNTTALNAVTEALMCRIIDIVFHDFTLKDKYSWIYRRRDDFGAFIEHVYIDLFDIVQDDSLHLVEGQSYYENEYKFYGTKVKTNIFGKLHDYMIPYSVVRRQLRDAFTGESEMASFIGAQTRAVERTVKMATIVFAEMLVADAIAIVCSTNGTGHEIPLVTNYNTEMGYASTDDGYIASPTQALHDVTFGTWALQQIDTIISRMSDYTTAFNDGTIGVTADKVHLTIHKDFDAFVKFAVKSGAFNPDLLSIGDYETVTRWQGIKNASGDYDFATTSKVMISADSDNTLGIGTSAKTVSNVIGFACSDDAIGLTNMYESVDSKHCASAEFDNYFIHRSVNGAINKREPMVVFTLN